MMQLKQKNWEPKDFELVKYKGDGYENICKTITRRICNGLCR